MPPRVRSKEKTGNYAVGDQCRHYWIIETAHGPKSRGVCRYCGEARDFLNSIPGFTLVKPEPHPLNLPRMSQVKIDKHSKS